MIGPKQQMILAFPNNWDDSRKGLYQRLKNLGPINLAKLLKKYKKDNVTKEFFQANEDVVKHIFRETGIDFEQYRDYIYSENSP